MNPRLFCFGLGYSASVLAAILHDEGWQVAGTCRPDSDAGAFEALGYEMHRFDGTAPMPNAAAALKGTTHLLSSVPPGPNGDPVLAHHADDIATIQGLAWIGYLSTTGVYGDRQGGWVDETSSLEPTGARGNRRVDAEVGWLSLKTGAPVHAFRLAGIYGPGRSALDTVRSSRARRIVKPGQVFSRTHVDDIAQILRASMAKPHPGAAYNVCDDEAAPPQEVIAYACDLLGVEPPPEIAFDEAELSDMAKSFYRDNKRVSNKRIKDELGVILKWPNYREGLRGMIA
ncbi:MAG: SDR family NAD(P)-dependent oxidoreductase [Alphaproteobacteria bacterium]|nr:SDR family NAD(P)-dependent oxidoreductase [Alphaproteobacteria bacterium]